MKIIVEETRSQHFNKKRLLGVCPSVLFAVFIGYEFEGCTKHVLAFLKENLFT
jgi:hypothetical protein